MRRAVDIELVCDAVDADEFTVEVVERPVERARCLITRVIRHVGPFDTPPPAAQTLTLDDNQVLLPGLVNVTVCETWLTVNERVTGVAGA